MPRIIFWAFLLLLGAGVLGATVFQGQIAGASGKRAAKPAAPAPTHVIVDNTPLGVNGTVNVGTMPSVKVDPTGNTVQVASSQSNPLSVTNVNDGQNVYRSASTASCSAGAFFCAVTLAPVSSGQRLVAETVSAHFFVPTGTVVTDGLLAGGAGFGLWLTPVKLGSDGTNDYYTMTQQMRVYVGPAENVRCGVDFSAVLSANAQVVCTVEGYLVGAP